MSGAAFDRNRDFEDAVAGVASHALAQAHALVLEEMRALAVDRDLELLAWDEAADAEVLDRELVFAVGRELVVHEHPAARAERQPLDVVVL